VLIATLALGLALGAPSSDPAPSVDAPVPEAGADQAPSTLDFELLPPEPPPDPAKLLTLEHDVRVRRSLIQWHTGLGIATTILMAATVITGQLDYTDRFGGGTSTGQYEAWHTGFEALTTTTFAVDGLLALFAPVPYPKEDHSVSSLTVHKVAMIIATLGFASEVPLGIVTVAREGHADQSSLALVHLVVGYVTSAAMVAGVSALGF